MVLLLVVAGCGDDTGGSDGDGPGRGDDDITGPFTGAVQRYAIDRIAVSDLLVREAAHSGDLVGVGYTQNQLANLASVLQLAEALTTHPDDPVAAGAVAGSLEVQADDLATDDTVQVWYRGREGASATPMGGAIVDGTFRSNPTRTTAHPGAAELVLPFFADGPASRLDAIGTEIELVPDGHGGFDGVLRGGLKLDTTLAAAADGIVTEVAQQPQRHRYMARSIDTNLDGERTVAETITSNLFAALVKGDLRMFDGNGHFAPRLDATDQNNVSDADAISFAIAFHASPCATGTCLTPPAPTCFDRVANGDETDIDCGGSCGACAAAQHCAAPTDCQAGACDAGLCRAPSCDDGIADGTEMATDCGYECAGCAAGERCYIDEDCLGACSDNSSLCVGN